VRILRVGQLVRNESSAQTRRRTQKLGVRTCRRRFIFIATNRLKPGRLDRERARVPGLVEFIEANEPRLIAFNEYADETGDEVTVVQVHPDAASMEAHMQIVAERARAAYAETLDATARIQVFGRPADAILETLRQQAGSGVEITINGEHLGGFTRSAAAE
jgi:quinol monooxygenase YgiN